MPNQKIFKYDPSQGINREELEDAIEYCLNPNHPRRVEQRKRARETKLKADREWLKIRHKLLFNFNSS